MTANEPPPPRSRAMPPALLAFVSGYVDAAVFLAMGGLFVAHVTGNFVLLGTTLAGAGGAGHAGAATLQLISFPVFFAGAFAAAVVTRWRGGRSSTRALVAATAAIVLAAASAGWIFDRAASAQAMGFALAMGVLNAAHRLDPSLGPPFTVMTGNVTALAVRAAGAGPAQPGPAIRGTLALVAGFALGCAAGALGEQAFGLAAMLVPALLLAGGLLWR